MKRIRWLIVAGLERACSVLDHFRCLGCTLGLASLSARLEDRWRTGWWEKTNPNSTVPGVRFQ
jgi:hypothetical protein